MSSIITLEPLGKAQLAEAQGLVTRHHYLRKPVDSRCSVEGYSFRLDFSPCFAGVLLFGRPQATRCGDWYGSVEDVENGRCEVTRWQVLNLARVWIRPAYQGKTVQAGDMRVRAGGIFYSPDLLPGYTDRKGVWRSTLASDAVRLALDRVRVGYLLRRPPCFLDEPYELRYVLSYCDTRLHKGTLYRAAGFELYRTNEDGIQTWRKALKPLTKAEDNAVRQASIMCGRSQMYRARRSQTKLFEVAA